MISPRGLMPGCHAHACVGMRRNSERTWAWPNKFGHGTLVLVLMACFTLAMAADDFTPLPNADFTAGTDKPAGWTLSGGQGRWVERHILEVTGDGKGSNQWQCAYHFQPGGLYRFQFRGRAASGSGCVISGPSFANHDWQLTPEWKWYSYVFRAPDGAGTDQVRLGQWEAKGTFQFDAVRLSRVLPIFAERPGKTTLSEGESIHGGVYAFSGTFGAEGTNYHRTLHSATAAFNSDRWCFDGRSQVTYRFAAPLQAAQFRSGRVAVTINYLTRGGCLAELSRDGTNWRTLLTQEKVGTAEAVIPPELLPAQEVLLRLKASATNSTFQVQRIDFTGDFDRSVAEEAGCRTIFADIASTHPSMDVVGVTIARDSLPMSLFASLKNNGKQPQDVNLVVSARAVGAGSAGPAGPSTTESESFRVPPGEIGSGHLPLPLADAPGPQEVSLSLQTKDGQAWKAAFVFSVHDFHRADYGRLLGGRDAKTAVWWCDATHKIPPQRALPLEKSSAAELSAARNEHEAVQIVVRPKETEALKGLTAAAGPLSGPGGAKIAAENIKILRVAYHFVHHPTDASGISDWWPDALPPLRKPLDLPAGKNQPLWVLVYVPRDAKPGDYTGTLSLKAEGWSAEVPIKLHVWNFTLPQKNHLETALGLSPHEIWRYHQLKTEEDKRRVLDMYLQSFAEHRISPYDPTPLDPVGVKFLTEADPPRAELDFSRFDPAMTRALEKFRFTNFMLHVQAMGGGTFHQRFEPSIGKYGEDTPQYQAAFASYIKQLEGHLREKGWLKMSYIYWFDEPDPKDYAFVRKGMERLKKYAPGLTTMLTEEPGDPLAGPIDIWCPVSFNYNHAEAEKRRAAGERIWWYVCCGPKAPYCTLFIDHPATEMRVWLWQTWQRNIAGILIWSTNYWTSDAAYPERPQNPYEDPMGYVSGYSTPRGVKNFWGNGDGRFLYPPEAAAVPGASGKDPVIEPPVSSMRWEMLREGIEDFEYLCLLRELLAKRRGASAGATSVGAAVQLPPQPGKALTTEEVKQYEDLLKVPETITRDMTTFTTDPAPIYARRAAIAAAIERLQP